MKRRMILAAILGFALFHLSACASSEVPAPAQSQPQSSTPSQSQPAQPDITSSEASTPSAPTQTPPVVSQDEEVSAPEEDALALEPEENPSEIQTEQAQPPYLIPYGIWLAKTDAGYTNYYYSAPDTQSLYGCNLDFGLVQGYTYDGSGMELEFTLRALGNRGSEMFRKQELDSITASEVEQVYSATVEVVDEQQLILHWGHSLPEYLSFVDVTPPEEFNFLSNEELCQMALDYYTQTTGLTPGSYGSMTNEDNTVTIQLYDNLGDHNSTAAWYIVDRFSAAGIDMHAGEEIDFNI